jgi:hypothetical protein
MRIRPFLKGKAGNYCTQGICAQPPYLTLSPHKLKLGRRLDYLNLIDGCKFEALSSADEAYREAGGA